MTNAVPTLAQYLRAPLNVGEPDVVGPLAVFPLFGPEPELEYLAFADGVKRGVTIRELERGASVNDLTVLNAADAPVLLYNGEEVLGAQQNRTFDVSILVGAGAKIDVPVSCVEHGRWDGSRHEDAFAPAPQAAYPALRRIKNSHIHRAVAAGMPARAEQGQVWDEVAAKHVRMATASPTGAMHDIYDQRRDRLTEMLNRVARREEQVGAVVAIGGEFTVLDHVSRSDVYAVLHGPLVQGYALDALECPEEMGSPSVAAAQEFATRVSEQRVSEHDGIGLGRDARFQGNGVVGAALVAGHELVQLTAFSDDGDDDIGSSNARGARIRRPSRRRSA